jgi:hypothetical protein
MTMPPHLQFTEVLTYSSREVGITLRVKLTSGGRECETEAKFDPGAHVCLFSREIGELLQLDVERGVPITLGSSIASGKLDAFGHEVTLQVGSIALPLIVYFSRDYGMLNFIGRQGWLPRVIVGIVDYEQKMYLALYQPDNV